MTRTLLIAALLIAQAPLAVAAGSNGHRAVLNPTFFTQPTRPSAPRAQLPRCGQRGVVCGSMPEEEEPMPAMRGGLFTR